MLGFGYLWTKRDESVFVLSQADRLPASSFQVANTTWEVSRVKYDCTGEHCLNSQMICPVIPIWAKGCIRCWLILKSYSRSAPSRGGWCILKSKGWDTGCNLTVLINPFYILISNQISKNALNTHVKAPQMTITEDPIIHHTHHETLLPILKHFTPFQHLYV